MWIINFETGFFTLLTLPRVASATLKALGFGFNLQLLRHWALVLTYKGLMPLLFLTYTFLSTFVYILKTTGLLLFVVWNN